MINIEENIKTKYGRHWRLTFIEDVLIVSRYCTALCATEELISSKEPINKQKAWASAVCKTWLWDMESKSSRRHSMVTFSTVRELINIKTKVLLIVDEY